MEITQTEINVRKRGGSMIKPSSSHQFRWLIFAAITIAAATLTCGQLATPSGVTRLFARWDVLMVALFAAAPVTLMIVSPVECTNRKQNAVACLGVIIAAVIILQLSSSLEIINRHGLIVASLSRSTVACAVTLVVVMLTRVIATASQSPLFLESSWAAKLTLISIALLVPAAYVDSVAEGSRIELEKALQSRRFALAKQHAEMLMQLHPNTEIQDRPLDAFREELDALVKDLDSATQRPLPRRPSSSELGQRVMILMQLDRNEEAMRLLSPLTHGPRFEPISLDYLGLCFQRLERFEESLHAYQAAVTYWKSQAMNERSRASLASAWKGVGFAARRLNHRRTEEHAYQQLVELAPTAENHMLLAQCYREHQKTRLASEHTTRAAQLAPEMQAQSDSMLSSMSTDHFGCWLVPRR
ncbi:hypothetical protein [Rhodopirellula sp. SWK7]|uniref:hypothetical protein n=1 Tax=Rhodopirellula sp. SWK7 TaxID=595460 RepID=UPI001181C40E|nr:hypothetical protein [Rhodopirellula sp. SWK7]